MHSADNLAVLREAGMHLYDLIAESYANDEQVTANLHVFEDSAPNSGLASFDWPDKEFSSTEIEDTMHANAPEDRRKGARCRCDRC